MNKWFVVNGLENVIFKSFIERKQNSTWHLETGGLVLKAWLSSHRRVGPGISVKQGEQEVPFAEGTQGPDKDKWHTTLAP